MTSVRLGTIGCEWESIAEHSILQEASAARKALSQMEAEKRRELQRQKDQIDEMQKEHATELKELERQLAFATSEADAAKRVHLVELAGLEQVSAVHTTNWRSKADITDRSAGRNRPCTLLRCTPLACSGDRDAQIAIV